VPFRADVPDQLWVDCATARVKLVAGQVPFLDRLLAHLRSQGIAHGRREARHVAAPPSPVPAKSFLIERSGFRPHGDG